MKILIRVLFLFITISASAREYTADDLLVIIDKSRYSAEFKKFKEYWLLDNANTNTDGGIMLSVSTRTETIDSVILAGKDFMRGGIKFRACTSKLPLGIMMDDDSSAINLKFGTPIKVEGLTITSGFSNYLFEVVFSDASFNDISSIKFYTDRRPKSAVIPQNYTIEKTPQMVNEKRDSVRRQIELEVIKPGPPPPPPAPSDDNQQTIFRKAIYDLLESASTMDFLDVKGVSKPFDNPWNYKYTYTSKIKVPGEKYSMLYRFPFVSSKLDFVCVLRETYNYDNSFIAAYHQIEKQLLNAFPATEGWISACSLNPDKSKLADLQVKNSYLGAIVLNYQKTPRGKHVLYLRFLPNTN